MSRREEILIRAAEARLRERDREKKYDPEKMDCEKMPPGCWLWILAFGLLAFFLFTHLVRNVS